MNRMRGEEKMRVGDSGGLERRCCICMEWLPITEYGSIFKIRGNGTRRHEYQAQCKSCHVDLGRRRNKYAKARRALGGDLHDS